MRTYYEVLGVEPSATTDECLRAYRVRAQLLHPDHHAGASLEVVSAAESAMRELNEAWSVLGDASLRSAYDTTLNISASDPKPRGLEFRAPGVGECRFCGCQPAVNARLRTETGKVLWRTRRALDGPFCRDCGLSTFRYMTNRTLITGWWGFISFFANCTSLFGNLEAWRRFTRLSDPRPTPGVVGLSPRPLATGPSLWRRPGVYFAAVVLVVVILIASNQKSSGSTAGTAPQQAPSLASLSGSCFLMSGASIRSVVSCSAPHDAYAPTMASDPSQCPASATNYMGDPAAGPILCIVDGR